MTAFSFKKETKVYVVYKGGIFNIDISSIDFSQSFEEHSYSNKTLQIKNMFEQTVINKANPATFELTFPTLRESDLRVLFDRVLDYGVFDLYVEAGPNLFKITNCVITRTVFNIQRDRPLSMGIGGEASRLSYEGPSNTTTIPGTAVPRSGTRTYNKVQYLNVILGSLGLQDSLTSIVIEIENDVNWIPYTSVNDALEALDSDSSMYPSSFVVNKRNLAGSFSLYDLQDESWYIKDTLYMQIGEKIGNTVYGFEFDIKEVSHTSNVRTGDIFSQQHSWRMTQNPDSLYEVITYIGYTDSAAIQDSWDIDILDNLDNPILES